MRDRAGLVFLTIAPLVVITVAGLSLASLYGASPRGSTAYLLPVADEDGGEVGRTIRERLAAQEAVVLEVVPSREAARERVRSREAGVALVIGAGASAALARGERPELLVYTDPVKYLEVANVRALLQELRHGLEAAAWERARERLEGALREAERARSQLEARAARARDAIEAFGRRARAARAAAEREVAAALQRSLEEARRQAVAREAELRRRAEEAIARLREFLEEFSARRDALAAWIDAVRARAGRHAGELPPAPQPPAVPEALRALASGGAASLLGTDTVPPGPPVFSRPRLPEPPPLPELPELTLPELPEASLPGTIELRETSVTGAPQRLNTFDQNVPGFSVTFLLLGMLLGVSLSLLDERNWGTLARSRTTPTPFSALLVGKLLARFGVGMAQMTLLFLLGRIAFGISLGPEPWALGLPIAGIVFAGTALGLVVAAVAPSRESVLPVGSIVIVTMAAVGGCWWPIDLEPRWMREVALAFPTTWAMAAFNDLMIRRQGLDAALRPTAVLFGYGAVTLLVGLALFRRRL